MPGDPAVARKMTWDEYVAWEATQETKHEFVDGEVFAMSGGTLAHAALPQRLGAIFYAQWRGRPCRSFSSDARVRTPSGRGFYPDLSAACGAILGEGTPPTTLLNPSTIVEVLSPATEAYDRGDKFTDYQSIASLQEYVLVSSTKPEIQVFTRASDHWELRSYGPGDTATLSSIGCTVPVDELYEGLLEAPPAASA